MIMLATIKNRSIALGVLLVFLILYAAFTSPLTNKMFTTVGFLLLVYLIVYLFISIIVSLSLKGSTNVKLNSLSLVLAIGPVYLLALASLNTVGLIDIFFVAITEVIVVWYLSKVID